MASNTNKDENMDDAAATTTSNHEDTTTNPEVSQTNPSPPEEEKSSDADAPRPSRRRRIRNETLTIVWNYIGTTIRAWLGKAEDAGAADTNRFRLWRILEGNYDGKPYATPTNATSKSGSNDTNEAMDLQDTEGPKEDDNEILVKQGHGDPSNDAQEEPAAENQYTV